MKSNRRLSLSLHSSLSLPLSLSVAKGWIQGLNGPPDIDDEGVAGELENYIQPVFSMGMLTRKNRFRFIRGVMLIFHFCFLVPVFFDGP